MKTTRCMPQPKRKPRAMAVRDIRVPTEHAEQSMVCDWLNAHGVLHCAIPNGAKLAGGKKAAARQMAKLKAEGLQPGIPDLLIIDPLPGDTTKRVWLEMKRTRDSDTSPEQEAWHGRLMQAGDVVVIAYGADQAIRALVRLGFGARR
jgi:hypothetical protein